MSRTVGEQPESGPASIYCQACGTEMSEDTQFCPDCGTEVGGQGSNDDHAGLKVLGLISAFLSIFFLPIILGPATMFCGYRLSKHGQDKWGRGLMLGGGFCMAVGMLLALAILL